MILICGIPEDRQVGLVLNQLDARSANYILLDQHEFASWSASLEIDNSRIGGQLERIGKKFALQEFRAVYTRMIDESRLTEFADCHSTSPSRHRSRDLFNCIRNWLEIAPVCVVNRAAHSASNGSKPYQAQLIRRHGFLIPETLVTSDPEVALGFFRKHRQVVYKSISGIRSIVKLLNESDLNRLEQIRWCPVQFQVFVGGTNVRVHVIGRQVYATAVTTDATDYRYARLETGESAKLRPVMLADDLAEQCIGLSRSLGLEFAGIDLKINDDGEVYCFEVNPSPGFGYFEINTGQRIAEGLAEHLISADAV